MPFLNKMFEKPCSYHYIYIAKKCNCLSMFHFCQYFLFGFSKKNLFVNKEQNADNIFLKRESESFFILAVFLFLFFTFLVVQMFY